MSRDRFDHDTATEGEAAQEELARLRRANLELASRLAEAEDTLAAIRNGDVDALIVGEDIYTLDSANAASVSSASARRDASSRLARRSRASSSCPASPSVAVS